MLWSVWSVKVWFTQPCQSQSEPSPGPLLDLSGRTLSSTAKVSAQGCGVPSAALWGKPDKASWEGSGAEWQRRQDPDDTVWVFVMSSSSQTYFCTPQLHEPVHSWSLLIPVELFFFPVTWVAFLSAIECHPKQICVWSCLWKLVI